jgi:hypothetical protein
VARSARAEWIVAAVAAITVWAAFAGCDGKVIRLGGESTPVEGGACAHAQVPANQVLWTGDSWQLVPVGAEAHTDVLAMARTAGAAGLTENYAVAAAPATTMAQIAAQYTSQEATATKVKVLIMDGGTWDTITNNSATTVNDVATTFNDLLSTVATDGTVTDVIYFLMPDLIPGVTALRPLLEQDCAASPVRCHFLDLQQFWTNPTDYTTSTNPPVPTADGALVIAQQIWAIMQASCIAQ